ncbi:TPA: hypothetical protein ACNV27_003025 [Citrobacter gillenii]|nr:hypothetical protein [Citrobacter freundii]
MSVGGAQDEYCRKPGWTLTDEDRNTVDRFIEQFGLSVLSEPIT